MCVGDQCTFNSDLHKIRTALDRLEHNYCVLRGASVPVHQTTWHRIPKDGNVLQHHCENLQSVRLGVAVWCNWNSYDLWSLRPEAEQVGNCVEQQPCRLDRSHFID